MAVEDLHMFESFLSSRFSLLLLEQPISSAYLRFVRAVVRAEHVGTLWRRVERAVFWIERLHLCGGWGGMISGVVSDHHFRAPDAPLYPEECHRCCCCGSDRGGEPHVALLLCHLVGCWPT